MTKDKVERILKANQDGGGDGPDAAGVDLETAELAGGLLFMKKSDAEVARDAETEPTSGRGQFGFLRQDDVGAFALQPGGEAFFIPAVFRKNERRDVFPLRTKIATDQK